MSETETVSETVKGTTGLQSDAQQYLRDLLDAIERLDAQRKGICDDMKERWDDAKDRGYDLKVLKRILKDRKKKKKELQEEMQVYDVYAHAVGLLSEEV